MLSKKIKGKDLFWVSCADWNNLVSASDSEDAATLSIEVANKEYGKNLNLSPTIEVYNLTKTFEKNKNPESCKVFFTPDVLADAGLYNLSKKYSTIINLMKKDET